MKKLSVLLLAGLLATTPVSAQNLPDLGSVSSGDLSSFEEQRIGDSIMREIRWSDPDYLDDIEIEDYVSSIGRRLVEVSDSPTGSFDFFIIKNPSINAFALPGGYIGVHSGLLLTAETESEFASVMGHEIAHVTQRHIAQIYGKQGQSTLLVLGSLLVGALAAGSNPDMAQAAMAAGQAGAIQQQLNFTRAFEREADRVGLQLLERAGFDPRGMPSFFTRMQRANRAYESSRQLPGYLRTHPMTSERFTDMQSRVAQMRYRQVLDSLDFAFARAKLRADQGLAVNAISYFRDQLDVNSDDVSRYGLARALLRGGNAEEATEVLSGMGAQARESSWTSLLAAEIELAQRRPDAALRILESALQRNTNNRALSYARIDAMMAANKITDAARLAREEVGRDRTDPRLWQRLSRAEESLGNRTAYHRAQAEVYALHGGLSAAIEQLELARRAGDQDFYEQSAVDARMRALKAEDRERRAALENR